MAQRLIYSQRVHLATYALARFERSLEVVPGDFDGDHKIDIAVRFSLAALLPMKTGLKTPV